MGWFTPLKRFWDIFWVFGRRRLEIEAAERIDHTDKMTPEEKEALKGAIRETLDEVKAEVDSHIPKKKNK